MCGGRVGCRDKGTGVSQEGGRKVACWGKINGANGRGDCITAPLSLLARHHPKTYFKAGTGAEMMSEMLTGGD